MIGKCLPKYLLVESQFSTSTRRGWRSKSRGLVDAWVEGCDSLIRFIEGDTGEFVEGVDTYSQTITQEKKISGARREKSV